MFREKTNLHCAEFNFAVDTQKPKIELRVKFLVLR